MDKGGKKMKKRMMDVVSMGMAVILVFLFVTMSSASVVPATQRLPNGFIVNYDNVSIKLDGKNASILVGQVIQFYNATGGPSGKVKLKGISENNAGEVRYSDANGRIDTTGMKTGDYEAIGEAEGCNSTIISFGEATMELKLKVGTKTVKSVPQGTRITVKFSTSLDPNDGMTLKVTDPNGYVLKTNPADGTIFEKVNVSHISDLEINTAGWEIGSYSFIVSTEEEYARGLRKESNKVELEIVSPELKIKAEKTEIVETEKVKLTVNGVPDHNISVTAGGDAVFPGGVNDNPATTKIGNFSIVMDEDGRMEFVVYFEKTGTFTVKVRDEDSGAEDYTDISVLKKKVTFYMDETCVIGADLVVNGTVNIGKTVDIAIEDRIVKANVPIDREGRFEVKLPTPETPGTSIEGCIKVRAFIDGGFSEGDDVSGQEDDGSFMVLLVKGGLDAELSAKTVAPGDSFTISGSAPGSKVIDIIIVSPDGGSGEGMNPQNSEENGLPRGITYETASVSSSTYTWSVDIDVQEEADKGNYLIFVLSPGKNGRYDGVNSADLLEGLKDKYLGGDLSRLASKTQSQIKSIILDATTDAAGSDDLLKILEIAVEEPKVSLNPISDIVIGEDLIITGTSNREGHIIIVKVSGPVDLGTKFVRVEDGKFEANFSTYDALTGKYMVEADDGEGHTDTMIVNITLPVREREVTTHTSTAVSPEAPSRRLSNVTAPPATPEPETEEKMQSQAHSALQPESQRSVQGFECISVVIALFAVHLFRAKRKRRK